MRSLFFALAGLTVLSGGCYAPKLPDVGLYCRLEDDPACPSGSTCKPYQGSYRCIADSLATLVSIPKSGSYTGPRKDAQLNSSEDCPDNALEPNDEFGSATVAPVPMPDSQTPKIIKLAICPLGKKPGDIDFYKVDLSGVAASSLNLFTELSYDVSYGDLDVGIFDSAGMLLASDGSAVSNGCVSSSVSSGVYYVGVVGASAMDVNRYELHIRTFSSPRSCGGGGTTPPRDM